MHDMTYLVTGVHREFRQADPIANLDVPVEAPIARGQNNRHLVKRAGPHDRGEARRPGTSFGWWSTVTSTWPIGAIRLPGQVVSGTEELSRPSGMCRLPWHPVSIAHRLSPRPDLQQVLSSTAEQIERLLALFPVFEHGDEVVARPQFCEHDLEV